MNDSVNYDVELFVAARDYLSQNLEPMLATFLCGVWDPLIETVIIKELNKMIDIDLEEMFPELPEHMRPQYSYRIFTEDNRVDGEIEMSIQQYFNPDRGLKFLGNYNQTDMPYDLYCTPYYDGLNNFLFYARYGHLQTNCFTGSAEARSEYHLGMMTPLSVAYGMAIHDGYINE